MERSLETLPPEQSQQLLRLLPPHDLCRVVLTSSTMQTIASDPKLWSSMKVKKSKIYEEGLKKLFTIKRFSEIRKIDLSGMTFTAEKLLANINAIAESSVKDLNLYGVCISQVPAQLLYQVAGRLHKMDLGGTDLTTEQSIAVMEACVSSPELVEVSLTWIDLHEVPVQLLAKAAKGLHKVDLSDTGLTSKQTIAVLEACASSPELVDVSLYQIDLSEVPPQLLAQAVKHLHKMDLIFTRLTTEQSIAILEAYASSLELVEVSLTGIDLHEVPPQLLAQAAKHHHKVDLRYTRLTTEQSIAVLEACTSSTGLVEVSLAGIDLRNVPPQLLDQAARHLHKMDLGATRLTTEQSIAVLEACASSTGLVEVSLAGIDLREVPAELLARARDTGCLQG